MKRKLGRLLRPGMGVYFGVMALFCATALAAQQYWLAAEKLRRAFLSKRLPPEFFAQRDAIQRDWITQAAQIPTAEFAAFSARCLDEEAAFFEKWNIDAFDDAPCGKGFRTRWAKKNTVLFPEDLL